MATNVELALPGVPDSVACCTSVVWGMRLKYSRLLSWLLPEIDRARKDTSYTRALIVRVSVVSAWLCMWPVGPVATGPMTA